MDAFVLVKDCGQTPVYLCVANIPLKEASNTNSCICDLSLEVEGKLISNGLCLLIKTINIHFGWGANKRVITH
jgi:hypothetical protein